MLSQPPINAQAFCFALFTLFYSFGSAQNHTRNLPGFDQHKRWHFGASLGINNLDFRIDLPSDFTSGDTIYSILSEAKPGFSLSIVSNLHLGQHFDLRAVPGLAFGARDIEVSMRDKNNLIFVEKRTAESSYIDIPIYLKYKSSRVSNAKAYLFAGGRIAYDFESLKDVQNTNLKIVKLKSIDYGYLFGIGGDFYFEYFKFSTELKLDYGLRDLLVRDDSLFTAKINSLKSKNFLISVTFEI